MEEIEYSRFETEKMNLLNNRKSDFHRFFDKKDQKRPDLLWIRHKNNLKYKCDKSTTEKSPSKVFKPLLILLMIILSQIWVFGDHMWSQIRFRFCFGVSNIYWAAAMSTFDLMIFFLMDLELFFCFKHDFAFRAKHIFVLFLMLLRTKIIFLDEILQKGYIDIVDIINIGDIIMISVILSLMLMTMLILIISHYLKLVVNIRNCCSI